MSVRDYSECEGTRDAPPKLPETTNLVLTRRRNEYNETSAMNIRTPLENSIPPLKKLFKVIVNLMRRMESDPTHAFPKNRIPVPTKDFKSYTRV